MNQEMQELIPDFETGGRVPMSLPQRKPATHSYISQEQANANYIDPVKPEPSAEGQALDLDEIERWIADQNSHDFFHTEWFRRLVAALRGVTKERDRLKEKYERE